jgi:hypothetical protein
MQHPQRLHGPAHLTLAGLSLWVLSRQFPQADNADDAAWLNIVAHVEAPGARVQTQGPIMRIGELARFLAELEVLNERLEGSAHLDCIEPELDVKLTCDRLGGIEIVVQITPDHMTQAHTIEFAADQTYLAPAIRDCRAILARFPVSAGQR